MHTVDFERSKSNAKRFNKFESSVELKKNGTGLCRRQGVKRTMNEITNEEVAQKRRYITYEDSGVNLTPSNTKNLANSRLARLRETLKAETIGNGRSDKQSNIDKLNRSGHNTTVCFADKNRECRFQEQFQTSHQKKHDKIVAIEASTPCGSDRARNLYQSEKWPTLESSPVNTPANDRLKRIKTNLREAGQSHRLKRSNVEENWAMNCTVPSSKHRSPLLQDKLVTGIKRNISPVSDTFTSTKRIAPNSPGPFFTIPVNNIQVTPTCERLDVRKSISENVTSTPIMTKSRIELEHSNQPVFKRLSTSPRNCVENVDNCLGNISAPNLTEEVSYSSSKKPNSPSVSNRLLNIKNSATKHFESSSTSKFNKSNNISNLTSKSIFDGNSYVKGQNINSVSQRPNTKQNSHYVRNEFNKTSNDTSYLSEQQNSTSISQKFDAKYNNRARDLSSALELSANKSPITSPRLVIAENSDNYRGKMKMTASWIMKHPDLKEDTNEHVDSKNNFMQVNVNSVSKTDILDDTEEMEWTNAEPDTEIEDNHLRTTNNNVEDTIVKKGPEKSKDLCIAVDTNVFISCLSKVKDILHMKITGPIQPILYIPWMVITELDYMKDTCSEDRLKKNVTSSIKFINKALEEKNPRILGQTVYDMERQQQIGLSPDDKIIACCLQVAQRFETVILLSNDLNLKNKAMINNIEACSAHEIIMKIMSKLTKNTKFQKIKHKMSMLCSAIISECAKETYGDVWSKMDMLSSPPWSFVDCLKRFKKYWNSVFKQKLMKQFTKTLQDLLDIFAKNKYFSDDSEDYVNFVKLCINLCIFLKDIEEYQGSVEKTLRDITHLA